MAKITKTICIDEDKWVFLAPILEQYVMAEEEVAYEKVPIDFDEVCDFCQGIRIAAILKNCDVHTVGELLRLDKMTFLRFRNVGKKSWGILQDYVDVLKQRYGIANDVKPKHTQAMPFF